MKEILDSDREAFTGIRMLFSTNASGAPLQIKPELNHVFSGIFSGSRLIAYSDSIQSEMESGVAQILYKQRALLDTNLLSDLPKYFNGEVLSTKSKVEEILAAIENTYGGGFDYTFAVLENLREFVSANNPYPVSKVAAAIYLDHKLQKTPKTSSTEEICLANHLGKV
ncbi:hypothetical protein GLGCALEP_04111 [Pseudomonas sp. MM221]|nr:hypothetical protein DBADOPDK_04006 [Pseudomonas sp. MM223]CAI3806637.1 hypothetical protein GLGCALEP_04111 [Pseudomonas sp. MM221]